MAFTFWKNKKNSDEDKIAPEPTWAVEAQQALEQAVAQAPVPAMLKNRAKQELKRAAEDAAHAAGRTMVTTGDLMTGMLAKMPASMRSQVEEAMRGGPEKLQELEKKLKRES